MSPASELVNLMRRIPFPVTIVTMKAGETVRGVTIGSFTSLSMDPPLVSFNLDCSSRAHELMEAASAFVVHIPGPEHEALCTRFARPDQDDQEQFRGVDYTLTEAGVPLLKGMIAEVHCTPEHFFTAGDHSLIAGRVRQIRRHREDAALLYLDGNYRSL